VLDAPDAASDASLAVAVAVGAELEPREGAPEAGEGGPAWADAPAAATVAAVAVPDAVAATVAAAAVAVVPVACGLAAAPLDEAPPLSAAATVPDVAPLAPVAPVPRAAAAAAPAGLEDVADVAAPFAPAPESGRAPSAPEPARSRRRSIDLSRWLASEPVCLWPSAGAVRAQCSASALSKGGAPGGADSPGGAPEVGGDEDGGGMGAAMKLMRAPR
jgi:hypothetical protein